MLSTVASVCVTPGTGPGSGDLSAAAIACGGRPVRLHPGRVLDTRPSVGNSVIASGGLLTETHKHLVLDRRLVDGDTKAQPLGICDEVWTGASAVISGIGGWRLHGVASRHITGDSVEPPTAEAHWSPGGRGGPE